MNSLDQLIRQSNILIEIAIRRTLNVSKSFIENYNHFLTNQIDVEFEIDID